MYTYETWPKTGGLTDQDLEELIPRAKEGDDEAIEELMTRSRKFIFQKCSKLYHKWSVAYTGDTIDDTISLGFIACHKAIGYCRQYKASRWWYTLEKAISTSFRLQYGRKRPDIISGGSSVDVQALLDNVATVPSKSQDKTDYLIAMRAIDNLDYQTKVVMKLLYGIGCDRMAGSQIQKLLNLPSGVEAYHIQNRGLEQLRKALATPPGGTRILRDFGKRSHRQVCKDAGVAFHSVIGIMDRHHLTLSQAIVKATKKGGHKARRTNFPRFKF